MHDFSPVGRVGRGDWLGQEKSRVSANSIIGEDRSRRFSTRKNRRAESRPFPLNGPLASFLDQTKFILFSAFDRRTEHVSTWKIMRIDRRTGWNKFKSTYTFALSRERESDLDALTISMFFFTNAGVNDPRETFTDDYVVLLFIFCFGGSRA